MSIATSLQSGDSCCARDDDIGEEDVIIDGKRVSMYRACSEYIALLRAHNIVHKFDIIIIFRHSPLATVEQELANNHVFGIEVSEISATDGMQHEYDRHTPYDWIDVCASPDLLRALTLDRAQPGATVDIHDCRQMCYECNIGFASAKIHIKNDERGIWHPLVCRQGMFGVSGMRVPHGGTVMIHPGALFHDGHRIARSCSGQETVIVLGSLTDEHRAHLIISLVYDLVNISHVIICAQARAQYHNSVVEHLARIPVTIAGNSRVRAMTECTICTSPDDLEREFARVARDMISISRDARGILIYDYFSEGLAKSDGSNPNRDAKDRLLSRFTDMHFHTVDIVRKYCYLGTYIPTNASVVIMRAPINEETCLIAVRELIDGYCHNHISDERMRKIIESIINPTTTPYLIAFTKYGNVFARVDDGASWVMRE